MSAKTSKLLAEFGVTPWQLVLAIAAAGMWWGTIKPVPAALEELNKTVQMLSTKVEVHGVLLNSVEKLSGEVGEMRRELSNIEGKLARDLSHIKSP